MAKLIALSPLVVAKWRDRIRRIRLVQSGARPEEVAAHCERVRAFWTPERRAAAVPPPGWAAREAAFEEALANAPDPVKVSASQPPVPPYTSIGKLLFQFREGGTLHRASAFAVTQDLVMTAAHCVVEPETARGPENPAINVLFCPQYDDDLVGEYAGLDVFYLDEYAKASDRVEWDFAFARVAPMPVAQVPGLEVDFTQPGSKRAMQLGYPVMDQYKDRESMWSSTATYTWKETRASTWLRMPSQFQGGASGGPWIDDAQNVVSLSSQRIEVGDNAWIDGPVLGEAAQVMYETVAGTIGKWNVDTGCGDHPTSVLYVESQNLVCVGVNGYVYAYDASSGLQKLYNGLGGYGKNEVGLASDGEALFVGINGYVLGLAFAAFNTVASLATLKYGGPTTLLLEGRSLFAGAGSQVCMITAGGTVTTNPLTGILGTVVGLAATNNWLYAGTGGKITPISLLEFTQPGPWVTTISNDTDAPVSLAVGGNELYAGTGGIVAQLLGMPGGVNTSNDLGLGDNEVRLALGEHHVYATCDGTVAAFARNEIQNGAAWTATLNSGGGVTNVLVVGARIFVGCAGLVYQLDANTGELLQVISLGASASGEVRMSPGAQGTLLFVGCSGRVYCYQLVAEAPTG